MRSTATRTPMIALTVALTVHACAGCTALTTSRVASTAFLPSAGADDPIEDLDAGKDDAEDSRDGAGEHIAQARGRLAEVLGEVNRFFVFGDPQEMNSSQFDAFSDRQMRAMRAEMDGGSSPR